MSTFPPIPPELFAIGQPFFIPDEVKMQIMLTAANEILSQMGVSVTLTEETFKTSNYKKMLEDQLKLIEDQVSQIVLQAQELVSSISYASAVSVILPLMMSVIQKTAIFGDTLVNLVQPVFAVLGTLLTAGMGFYTAYIAVMATVPVIITPSPTVIAGVPLLISYLASM